MQEKKLYIQVGIFVTIGIVMFFALIFLMGQERSMFESTTTLHTWFKNVSGLKAGAQVRLAGVTIGSVTEIDFSNDIKEKRLMVQMQVKSSIMPRIRKDSNATISSKGLLGDKVIEVAVGSPDKEQLKEGDFLISEEPPDIATILETGSQLLTHAKDVAKDLSGLTSEIGEDTIDNVKKTISHVENVLNEVRSGDGIVHGIIYDQKANNDFKGVMANARAAAQKLNKSVNHVEKILQEVRTGKGIAHSVIYEKGGKAIVDNLEEASARVTEIIKAVKDEKGMLHTLIYEEDRGNIVKNLNEATDDIKQLTKYIRSGQGTIGALINDPTVYEDLKTILGNIKRNKALKALIRMSIERGEEEGDSRRIDPQTQSQQK